MRVPSNPYAEAHDRRARELPPDRDLLFVRARALGQPPRVDETLDAFAARLEHHADRLYAEGYRAASQAAHQLAHDVKAARTDAAPGPRTPRFG